MNFQVVSISFQALKEEVFFLQIAVMFVIIIIIKQKNESKRKHRVPEFFHRQEEKRPFSNLTRNRTSRERVFFS